MQRIFNVGKFKHRITFQTQTDEVDEYGERLDGWLPFKTIVASKEPLIGKELYTALTTDSKVEVKFRSRYTNGINDRMRIQHKDNIYQIISVIDVNSENKEMVYYCRLV